MKIQSVIKNYAVLSQHLPTVLDDDAAGVFSDAATVVVVYQTRIYGLVDRTGFNARQNGGHVSESVCKEREQQGRTPSFHLKPVVEKEAVRRGDAFQPASFPIPYLAFFRVVFLHIQCGKLEPFPLFVICFEDRLLRTQPFLSRKQPQNLTKPILEPT